MLLSSIFMIHLHGVQISYYRLLISSSKSPTYLPQCCLGSTVARYVRLKTLIMLTYNYGFVFILAASSGSSYAGEEPGIHSMRMCQSDYKNPL